MSPQRVLLVDDDASIRRFVELALEDFDIELIACANVAEALAVLRAGPVQLLITDLMMPGQTGLDLLRHLRDDPALNRPTRVAVFSADIRPAVQRQLDTLDVWRQLSKPTSVPDLQACVRDALTLQARTAAGDTPQANPPAADLSAPEQHAVEHHFACDAALFRAFRASCRQQFPADLRAGDGALADGDAASLRRLAHSLKTVLASLGDDAGGALARRLEDACEGERLDEARALWRALRHRLAA